jgi:hypothetical protein
MDDIVRKARRYGTEGHSHINHRRNSIDRTHLAGAANLWVARRNDFFPDAPLLIAPSSGKMSLQKVAKEPVCHSREGGPCQAMREIYSF